MIAKILQKIRYHFKQHFPYALIRRVDTGNQNTNHKNEVRALKLLTHSGTVPETESNIWYCCDKGRLFHETFRTRKKITTEKVASHTCPRQPTRLKINSEG
jgi:hypothetical protein